LKDTLGIAKTRAERLKAFFEVIPYLTVSMITHIQEENTGLPDIKPTNSLDSFYSEFFSF
jgi:hypothetical protein